MQSGTWNNIAVRSTANGLFFQKGTSEIVRIGNQTRREVKTMKMPSKKKMKEIRAFINSEKFKRITRECEVHLSEFQKRIEDRWAEESKQAKK